MRRSSRDINVFSMSALDLFASALGAFMLLAVVFFPFFPNTGDDQGAVDDVKEKLVKAEGEAEAAEKAAVEAEDKKNKAEANAKGKQEELEARKSKPIQFPDIDIVVAMDTTGSMGDVVASLKAEIVSFTDLLNDWAPSVAMGFVDFKDRCDRPRPRVYNLTKVDARSMPGIMDWVNATTHGSNACNQDGEEAVARAIERALDMAWRSESKIRLVVAITDNAAYPEKISSLMARVAAFSDKDQGKIVASVFVPTRGSSTAGKDFLQQLAATGGGSFVEGTGFTSSILLVLGKI